MMTASIDPPNTTGILASLSASTTLIVFAVALHGLAFGTDHWIHTKVNQQILQDHLSPYPPTDPNLARTIHSRFRGLWRECFIEKTLNTTGIVKDPAQIAMSAGGDGVCLQVAYEVPLRYDYLLASDDYWTMIHLRRAIVGVDVGAMLCYVITAILGSAACWTSTRTMTKAAGLTALLGATLSSLCMCMWHGAEFVEKNRLNGNNDPVHLMSVWPAAVRIASERTYGWSYICAWAGVACGCMGSAAFLLSAWCQTEVEDDDSVNNSRAALYDLDHHLSQQNLGAYPIDEYYFAPAPVLANAQFPNVGPDIKYPPSTNSHNLLLNSSDSSASSQSNGQPLYTNGAPVPPKNTYQNQPPTYQNQRRGMASPVSRTRQHTSQLHHQPQLQQTFKQQQQQHLPRPQQTAPTTIRSTVQSQINQGMTPTGQVYTDHRGQQYWEYVY